jgi:hypothetical protein
MRARPPSATGSIQPGSVRRRLARVAPFFDDRVASVFDQDLAPRAPGHPVLDEAEHEAGGAGDHQDQADRVDADLGDVEVGRLTEDRSDRDQED